MKRKRGRPTKLTPEVFAIVERALKLGSLVQDARKLADIDTKTFYGWMKRGKTEASGPFADFRAMVVRTRAEVKMRCVGGILLAGQHDWKAYQYYLSVSDPKHYAPNARFNARLEHTGPDGEPLSINIHLEGKTT